MPEGNPKDSSNGPAFGARLRLAPLALARAGWRARIDAPGDVPRHREQVRPHPEALAAAALAASFRRSMDEPELASGPLAGETAVAVPLGPLEEDQ